MHPKDAGEDALPNLKAIAGREIDAILISHAHQDHIGTLPVLMRRFPSARIFMTEATAEIGSVLLHNSVNVMTRQREEIGHVASIRFSRIAKPIERSERWRWCPLRQRISIAGERAPQRERRRADVRVFRRRTRARLDRNSAARRRSNGVLHRRRQFRRSNDHASGGFSRREDRHPDHGMHARRHAKPAGWTRAE